MDIPKPDPRQGQDWADAANKLDDPAVALAPMQLCMVAVGVDQHHLDRAFDLAVYRSLMRRSCARCSMTDSDEQQRTQNFPSAGLVWATGDGDACGVVQIASIGPQDASFDPRIAGTDVEGPAARLK